MNTLKSITVVMHDGQTDHSFEVDLARHCVLVWDDAGWDLLADHYKHVKKDVQKEKAVRERRCPKATPKSAAQAAKLAAPAPGGEAVIAMKTPDCMPTNWP